MEYFPSWRSHRDKKPVLVKNAEEDEALGPGWADSPAKFPDKKVEQEKMHRSYRERFEAADGNPNKQALILIEYRSQHPKEAAADSWYKEVAPLIPLLQSQAQSQAMLNLVKHDTPSKPRKGAGTELDRIIAEAKEQLKKEGISKPSHIEIAERTDSLYSGRGKNISKLFPNRWSKVEPRPRNLSQALKSTQLNFTVKSRISGAGK